MQQGWRKIVIKYILYVGMALSFVGVFFVFALPSHVKAASQGDVLITEVEYNPPQSGTDAKYEWVEIYNNSDLDVDDLSNWTLSDNKESDGIPAFMLKAREFLVIAATQEGFLANFSRLPKNFLAISDGNIGDRYGLNNGGDSLVLRDPTGQIIDQISWNQTPNNLYVSDGYSIERVPFDGNFYPQRYPSPGLSPVFLDPASNITHNSLDLSWSVYDFTDFSSFQIYFLDEKGNEHQIQEIGDPNITNFKVQNLETATDYQFFVRAINKDGFSADSNIIKAQTDFDHSDSIIITEILPEPETNPNDEFIEIYNAGPEIVDLTGWYLDDIDGGSKPYSIPEGTKILSNHFLVFYKLQTGIALNDSGGDLARILWPDKKVVSQTENYGNAKKGLSWARNDDNWTWTILPTPGAQNQIVLKQKFVPTPAPTEDDPKPSAPAKKEIEVANSVPETPQIVLTVIETKTVVTTKTTKIVPAAFYLSQNTLPLVLADSTQAGPAPSKFNQFLLYFIGLIIIFVQVLSYEFYRRE